MPKAKMDDDGRQSIDLRNALSPAHYVKFLARELQTISFEAEVGHGLIKLLGAGLTIIVHKGETQSEFAIYVTDSEGAERASAKRPSLGEALAAIINGEPAKRCRRCRHFKHLNRFGVLRTSPDGLAYYCRACERQRDRRRRCARKKGFALTVRAHPDFLEKRQTGSGAV